jgi:hypothetical protein
MRLRNDIAIPMSTACFLVAGCSGGMGEPSGDQESRNVEQSLAAQPCRPDFALVPTADVACKVDVDVHLLNTTTEVSTADLYRDRGGCFPDAYQLRRIRSCRSGPIAQCTGGTITTEGDFCPRPRLSELTGTLTAPATVPVNPGPLGAGNAYVCWNSQFDTAQVWLTRNGTERLFGSGRSGCQSESNIQAGVSVVFTLFTDAGRGIALAESTTTGVPTACPPGYGPRCGQACYPPGTGCF